MIVDWDGLEALRGAVAMVDGGFDPLHDGHLVYFREAQQLGLPVLCNVTGDEWVAQKHKPLLTAPRRGALIDALEPVTYTHISDRPTAEVLDHLRPRYFVKGNEWEGELPSPEREALERHGIEAVFLDTKTASSTELLEAVCGPSDGDAVARFEELVMAQRQTEPEAYDEDYFHAGWREGGNRYDVETRREIEARNPQLIKEVFEPKRVLDHGCGPGALMYFLHELGVEVDGLDFAPASKETAPPEVADRIMIGSVTERLVPDESYDLVISREVLEHLTVTQVNASVGAMCAASSRYVYVTTRFHPEPDHLLDFTTQFDVDPTHITLLNKELLRALFVLEGFRRRPDLEERMDWGGKNRVLVYERDEHARVR